MAVKELKRIVCLADESNGLSRKQQGSQMRQHIHDLHCSNRFYIMASNKKVRLYGQTDCTRASLSAYRHIPFFAWCTQILKRFQSFFYACIKHFFFLPYFFISQCLFICIEVLWPSQPTRVMLRAVSLPNHTFSWTDLVLKQLTSTPAYSFTRN